MFNKDFYYLQKLLLSYESLVKIIVIMWKFVIGFISVNYSYFSSWGGGEPNVKNSHHKYYSEGVNVLIVELLIISMKCEAQLGFG